MGKKYILITVVSLVVVQIQGLSGSSLGLRQRREGPYVRSSVTLSF